MLKKLLIISLCIIGNLTLSAQIISGKVYAKNSQKPLENVSISTNLKTGTITNNFGEYRLDIKSIKTLTFSYLGYSNKTLTINNLKEINYVIYLDDFVNQLNEIQLNIAKISLDSLIAKATKSMAENYLFSANKGNFYSFEKQQLDFKELVLDLKSSSLLSKENRILAKEELTTFSNELRKNTPVFYKEFIGIISSKNGISEKTKKLTQSQNINSIVGYKNSEVGKKIDAKNIAENLQNIVLKHLKRDVSYKIKSGLLTLEDSLSLKKITHKNDSINKDNTFNIYTVTENKKEIDLEGCFVHKEASTNFLNQKYYEQKIEKNEFIGLDTYYVISFKPRKTKAKFAGKIYIDPFTFNIKKVMYNYAEGKRGEHVNLKWLLGIKFSENINSNTILYEKTKNGKIYASYFKNEIENYAFINRPIKFIENSEEKEKVKFNIKVELTMSGTKEFLFTNASLVSEKSIKPITLEEFTMGKKYISKKEYVNTDWQNKKPIIDYLKKYQ